jgi:nucleotide-binding universal stress UspA family protein
MNPNAAAPASILLTTDFSENASCAYTYAVGLARRHGAELTILHVVTGHSDYLAESEILKSYEQVIYQKATARLERLELPGQDGLQVRREIVSAWSAADGIVAFAQAEQPDLIILATHGHRLAARLILGSVARGVIATAPCPVFCVKCTGTEMLSSTDGTLRLARILVPVDLSEESRSALHLAVDYVKDHDAQLHLMYVVHVDVPLALIANESRPHFEVDHQMHSRISSRLQDFHREVDPEIEKVVTMVEKGSPAKRIAHYAESNSIDLIIVSRKGLGRTSHALGSVTGRLLHEAHCPILVM